MKPIHLTSSLLASVVGLALISTAGAREFGVSTSSYGRGTKVETERGGTAYVGPRGVAAEGAGGKKYAAGRRGAAYSGEHSAGATTRYGSAVVTDSGAAYARRYPAAPVAAPLPAGYIRTVPTGYTRVVYRGYNCYHVGGVYYRPVIYGGTTVYVVVQ